MSKTTLRMRLKASALAVALAALPLSVGAAGLGKLTVLSALGQPLRAELDITASRNELSSLTAKIASPEAFKQAGIEYVSALSSLRFSLDQRPDGQPYLRLSSSGSINEPFLDMLVELDWASGRLVREYTFLLDPPQFLKQEGAASAPVVLPEARHEMPPAAAPAAAPIAPQAASQAAPIAAPIAAPSAQSVSPATPKSSRPPRHEAAAKPEAATRRVKRGDTLSEIARESKPEGVSLDQMLVALFRGNRSAFAADNMNRLMSGKILSIPDPQAAAAIDPNEATKTVLAQSADFNAYRRKLAAAVSEAPSGAPAQRAASGLIVPRVVDHAPTEVVGKDKLEVSRSESPVGAKTVGKGGTERLRAIEEDLVARDKALKEANSRIAELQKNLDDLKKLVELKSQSMAALQQQAEAAKPAALATPVAPPPQPEAVKPALQPKPPMPAQAAPAAVAPPQPAQPVPAALPPAKSPLPAAARKTAPAMAKKPAPVQTGFIEDNAGLVYGGGGIVALLLAYLGYAGWRRRRAAADVEPPSTTAAADSVFAGGQSVDTSGNSLNSEFSQSGLAALDAEEGVDPVAEADVYLAYGRDTQAEEILLEARKLDPTRAAIGLKLLEIYAARKSIEPFRAIASEIYAQTGGVGPDWEMAALLVHKMDPENPLYGRSPAAPPSEVEAGTTEDGPLLLPETAVAPEQATDTQVLAQPGMVLPEPEEEPAALDFDLGLPAAVEAAPKAPADESGILDFELSPALIEPAGEYAGVETLVIPGRESESEAAPQEAAQIPLGPSLGPDEDAGQLDIDLSAPGDEAPSEAAGPAMIELERSAVASAKPLDLQFDLDDAEPAEEPAPEVSPPPPSVDFSKISLELDELAPPAEAAAVPTPPQAPSPQMTPTVAEEVATKLELAHAYEEMGDKEGARELLQEVISEGNAEQQAAAAAMLAQLG